MILHLIPQIMCKYSGVDISIKSLKIPSLDFTITSDNLMLRKPYPNKTYSVVCKRKGNKGMLGVLIDTQKVMTCFEVEIEWEVNRELLTESRWYNVLDGTFDIVTDDHCMFRSSGEFDSRFPEGLDKPPMDTEPCYMLYHPMQYQVKQINVHTISKKRYVYEQTLNDRLPSLDDMFVVGRNNYED